MILLLFNVNLNMLRKNKTIIAFNNSATHKVRIIWPACVSEPQRNIFFVIHQEYFFMEIKNKLPVYSVLVFLYSRLL